MNKTSKRIIVVTISAILIITAGFLILGKILPIGEIGFISAIIDFDPRDALRTVSSPGLLVFGGLDPQVPPDRNLAHLKEIFGGGLPTHLETVVIHSAQYLFRIVDSKCVMYADYSAGSISEDLIATLQDWLTKMEIGTES